MWRFLPSFFIHRYQDIEDPLVPRIANAAEHVEMKIIWFGASLSSGLIIVDASNACRFMGYEIVVLFNVEYVFEQFPDKGLVLLVNNNSRDFNKDLPINGYGHPDSQPPFRLPPS